MAGHGAQDLSAGTLLSRFTLDGRVAVVTGAAGGLGRLFAQVLIDAGARVGCIDRDADALRKTCREMGEGALPVLADVADPAAVERACGQITREWGGKIDILVNNAGIATPPARMGDVEIADWDRAIAVNLRSVFLCTRIFLPGLLAGGKGAVVNIASYLALKGVHPGFPVTAMPYTATKAAIVGMTRQLAVEYAGEGLRVNAIAPGWHLGTGLGRERRAGASPAEDARFVDFIRTSAPMGRAGEVEELGALLLYLASDASSYVTGQVFAHDGGQTAG